MVLEPLSLQKLPTVDGCFQYGHRQGSSRFRRELAKYLSEEYKDTVDLYVTTYMCYSMSIQLKGTSLLDLQGLAGMLYILCLVQTCPSVKTYVSFLLTGCQTLSVNITYLNRICTHE